MQSCSPRCTQGGVRFIEFVQTVLTDQAGFQARCHDLEQWADEAAAALPDRAAGTVGDDA